MIKFSDYGETPKQHWKASDIEDFEEMERLSKGNCWLASDSERLTLKEREELRAMLPNWAENPNNPFNARSDDPISRHGSCRMMEILIRRANGESIEQIINSYNHGVMTIDERIEADDVKRVFNEGLLRCKIGRVNKQLADMGKEMASVEKLRDDLCEQFKALK